MVGTIEISKLRNIQRLRFDIPDRGVWLLTAGNGAGKTSLLGCLRRIGHPNAFPLHFPSSIQSERLDNHVGGSVTYEIGADSVEYAYRGERWTPRPRSKAHLFNRFGYSSVTYIGATAERITPRPEDFSTRALRAVNKKIIDSANEIFDTKKFDMLRQINLARGVGNEAFVLAIDGNPTTYHSEKHFSLGELCVLKLLRLLESVNNNSMIIIDELEMALHPRAQVNLLNHLEDRASKNNLTVIFSTHSVTLLKAINRKKIIFLEKQDDGETKVIYGCYPTYAIGNIAADEETLPDVMLYVEDLFARDALGAFYGQYANGRYADPTMRPTVKVVPVGGFKEVVAFLERNRSVLPDRIVQKAVLDGDVSNETLVSWRNHNNHARLNKFQQLQDDIKFLPFTPEVGLMDYVAQNVQAFEQEIRARCNDNQLRVGVFVRNYDVTLQGGPRRRCAKAVVDDIIEYVGQRTQLNEDQVRDVLCGIFAHATWAQYKADFDGLFGPLM